MKMKENKHCTKETIRARLSVRERKKRGLDIAQSDVLKDTHKLSFSCLIAPGQVLAFAPPDKKQNAAGYGQLLLTAANC